MHHSPDKNREQQSKEYSRQNAELSQQKTLLTPKNHMLAIKIIPVTAIIMQQAFCKKHQRPAKYSVLNTLFMQKARKTYQKGHNIKGIFA